MFNIILRKLPSHHGEISVMFMKFDTVCSGLFNIFSKAHVRVRDHFSFIYLLFAGQISHRKVSPRALLHSFSLGNFSVLTQSP